VNWAFWRRGPAAYLRAVHYFGHAQPVNFWEAAVLSEAPAHLAQIRRDGFDAVILVVPWRGFQLTLSPATYDEQNLDRLRRLLAMVRDSGLQFIVRVSYPWNNNPDSEGSYDERILGLFTRFEVRKAWLAYLREIRKIAEAFDGFQFAFFSWEDLPSIRELMGHRSLEERRSLAQATGYRDYLAERYPLAEISRLFGKPITDLSEIYIPLPDCEAYITYHAFVDQALESLLLHGRSAWPRLSMQLRIDFDRLDRDGEPVWIQHDMRVTDPGMRVTYFFPFMYAQCHGETLSAAEVLVNLERMLLRVTDDGRNTRHFLDQFVFHDESPQFHVWARVRESEMGEYLLGAARLLRRYSRGFALWNYFDYRVNHFYNAAFLRGLQGWKAEGTVAVAPGGEPRFVSLAPGASITQRMQPDMVGYASARYDTMQFAARAIAAGTGGQLRLSADGVPEATIEVPSGASRLEATLPAERHRGGTLDVTLENTGTSAIEITDLCLWGIVYRSHVYDEHGRPGRYLEPVRAMLRSDAT